MSEKRNQSMVQWIVAAAVALPLLYVLSSGPMQTIAFRRHTSLLSVPGRPGAVIAETAVEMGIWWPRVYAPLWWVSEQS